MRENVFKYLFRRSVASFKLWWLKLLWKALELIGRSISWFKWQYRDNKAFRYFCIGIGCLSLAYMILNCVHTVMACDNLDVITIDAGHGYNTSGKRAYDGSFREWEINDKIARQIEETLEECYGIEVVRVDDVTGNVDVSLQERLGRAVNLDSDLHLSIHNNSFGETAPNNISGVETFYAHNNEDMKQLATNIGDNLANSTQRANRGAKSTLDWNLFVPREFDKANIDTVLIEGLNMNNDQDIQYMLSSKYVNDYSESVVKAIVAQYKLIAKNR